MKKLVLIDGNSLINRAFYATPPMSNSKGIPTNAVLGFINMLTKLTADVKPDYLLVAFDRKEPTFRHIMYDQYKGQRKPMPEDLRPQIQLLKDVLSSMNIAHYEQPGIEADDIIGAISNKYKFETVIVTGDKDSLQLVTENTSVYFTKRGISDIVVYNHDNFEQLTSILPHQIIDLKALMGDKSDNIPGVPGVGEKTALDLILKYGSVEEVLNHADNCTTKLQEKLQNGKDSCILSKKLATIDINANVDITIDDMAFEQPFPLKAKHMFADLEFRSLLKKPELFVDESIETASTEAEVVIPDVVYLDNGDQINSILNKRLAIWIGDDISLSDGKYEYRIKIKQNFFDTGFMFDQAVISLKSFLENEQNNIIVFSRKSFEKQISEFGIDLGANVDDVSIEKYIVDFSGKEDSVDDIMLYYHLPEKFYAYGLFKVDCILQNKLQENNQFALYRDIELPLAKVLYDMEKTGFKVDEEIIVQLREKYKLIIEDLTEKIYGLAGVKFNVNSPKQLGEVLFDRLNLLGGKKKKNQSTSAEVLESLYDKHEIIPLVLQYRKVSKLCSTYIEGFLPLIDKKTKLIHTVFNQTLTSTGRLSSKEPNLQNLPVRDEEGKEIRRFFIPSTPSRVLVGADYSQIELRLLAHFSNCPKLIKAYNNNLDIHSITASDVFGVAVDDVTKEMRRKAKAVNFGIIYGISEFGLAKNIKCSVRDAKEYIDKYFASYPNVKEYMSENVQKARANGYISTLCGRIRHIKDINSPNYNLRSFSERAAMNMPLQGSSADIIKIAMIRVYNRLISEGLKSKLILQVHDELVIDTELSELEAVKSILKQEMENAVKLNVPLVVDVYSGTNLSEAK